MSQQHIRSARATSAESRLAALEAEVRRESGRFSRAGNKPLVKRMPWDPPAPSPPPQMPQGYYAPPPAANHKPRVDPDLGGGDYDQKAYQEPDVQYAAPVPPRKQPSRIPQPPARRPSNNDIEPPTVTPQLSVVPSMSYQRRQQPVESPAHSSRMDVASFHAPPPAAPKVPNRVPQRSVHITCLPIGWL